MREPVVGRGLGRGRGEPKVDRGLGREYGGHLGYLRPKRPMGQFPPPPPYAPCDPNPLHLMTPFFCSLIQSETQTWDPVRPHVHPLTTMTLFSPINTWSFPSLPIWGTPTDRILKFWLVPPSNLIIYILQIIKSYCSKFKLFYCVLLILMSPNLFSENLNSLLYLSPPTNEWKEDASNSVSTLHVYIFFWHIEFDWGVLYVDFSNSAASGRFQV